VDSVDQHLEAVAARGWELHSLGKRDRDRQRCHLARRERTGIPHAELDAHIRDKLAICALKTYLQLVIALGLCRMDEDAKGKRQIQRRRKGHAPGARDTAPKDVEQPLTDGRRVA
jgi:hypothetical protein